MRPLFLKAALAAALPVFLPVALTALATGRATAAPLPNRPHPPVVRPAAKPAVKSAPKPVAARETLPTFAPGTPAAFAVTVRPRINDAALNKLGWKLASQAWTFRELTLFDTIDTLRALGIHYIELYPGQQFSKEQPVPFDHNSSPEMVDALLRKLKDSDVTAVNYGVVGIDDNEEQARKVFDFAKRLHLQTIVSEPPESAMPMLDRLCAEYKINIAIHDHPKPSHYWDPDLVLAAVKGTSKRIGSCSDTGHWYRSGLVPMDCLKKLQGRIVSLHFKDLDANKDDVPWGTGVNDAAGMLAELKRQKFRGVFSIEYERTSGNELISNVAKSAAFFSQQAEKLAKS